MQEQSDKSEYAVEKSSALLDTQFLFALWYELHHILQESQLRYYFLWEDVDVILIGLPIS